MTFTALVTTLLACSVIVGLVTNWRIGVVWALSVISLAVLHSVALTYAVAAALSMISGASDTSWM